MTQSLQAAEQVFVLISIINSAPSMLWEDTSKCIVILWDSVHSVVLQMIDLAIYDWVYCKKYAYIKCITA